MNKNNNLEKTLSDLHTQNKQRRIPPVDRWQPSAVSDFDITICDNGDWLHEGVKMTRQSLVDLFASVLWAQRDEHGDWQHYLRTPSDDYRIHVVDAPLFIHRVDVIRQDGIDWIEFGTTNGDRVQLDDLHTPYFKDFHGESRLYVPVRFSLAARFLNNAFFHLVNLGQLHEIDDETGTKTVLQLTSGGKTYTLIAA